MNSFEVDEVKHIAANWWDAEDFPFVAPWWFRYPAGVVAFALAYFVFMWADQAALNGAGQWIVQWVLGGALVLIGLALIRELLLFVIGISALWWFGTMAAANPIPSAIIAGALIIAYANK